VLALLDRLLYRHPFEGGSAERYARDERPAFGDLDDRLLDQLAPRLGGAHRLLDVGCGPATFALRAAARHPNLKVIALDPSRAFAHPHAGCHVIRGVGEELPLPSGAVDAAICLSSIRHVRDRAATLAELRRVVRDGGALVVVELDPEADADRIAYHADRLGNAVLRRAFGPLVVRTAPKASAIAQLATAAGWRVDALRADTLQPVYVMELS
jgi:ubiquinone/menaquinone biosynthesis C-methylase UbiE